MNPGGVGGGRRRGWGRATRPVLALVAAGGLIGWSAPPSLAATVAPAAPAAAAPSTATATVPSGSGAPTVVPAVPNVPRDITDNQDPNALLQRAISLSTVAASQAPLQATLAQAQQVLDAQSVAANHAQVAATVAAGRAAAAEAAARRAAVSATDLQGALREAALRIYTSGSGDAVPTNPGTTADEITDAAAYEETILSPDGILAQRKAVARVALASAEEKTREERAALHDQAVAQSALAAAAAATARIRDELAVLAPPTATLVSAERAAVSSQAGQSLTSPAALDFTPAAPLPSPLPTTAVALAWAFSELGKPYVWGGTGPDVFDCSGLTQYSWAHAGVAIPRVAADQDTWTVPVPLSQLLPGDLVFYGTTDIHHVGMYIGDGLMINAPHTGDVVRISPIWWSDLAGFGRVHSAGVPVPARVLPGHADPAAASVVPSAGAVPSESTPPPGYVAPPGATAPVDPTTTAPSKPGTGSTTTAPSQGTTTTSTTPTTAAVTTTTTTPPSVPTPTTTPFLGLGG
ncbi:C40 family peptidase [Acidiferrimicrobium sp. IK]|uniref:C40 family peptidase n=1 Tax=Acidiferrimicrobium sp. IK TaxID=2871700 RepID=UPI0021CB0B25|nr:C40 family peptidase [Acidiferrimicrobium sp. IK]MCU4184810.1 C40 family peptidase [Acidiferrimicrobium sp. IK]